MTRRAAAPRLGLALLFSLAGCAGAAPAARTAPAPQVPPGDLAAAEPAGPPATLAANQGTTGGYARVVLGGRRERVTELFRTFLRALMARDVDAVRALFDAAPINVDTGDVGTLEEVQRLYARIAEEDDVSQLAPLLERADAHVYSQRALGQSRAAAVPASMGADDWWIEISPQDLPPGSFQRPVPSMLVRIVGDAPRIVGVRVGRHAR